MSQFTELYDRFWQTLDNGQRAEIRRVSTIEDLETLPAFYHLMGNFDLKDIKQWTRVAFFLPFVEKHSEEAKPLGQQFKEANISEKRIFHIVRSTSPNDLIQLRRVTQQAKLSSINWQEFGKILFYWGDNSKKRIIQNFFIQTINKE